VPTFGAFADDFIATHESSWFNPEAHCAVEDDATGLCESVAPKVCR
jgi:hypothetical protein